MRINAALASALVSSAGLMGYVHAEDEVPAPDATSSAVERPTFTVCDRCPLSAFAVYLPSCAKLTFCFSLLAYHHQGPLC